MKKMEYAVVDIETTGGNASSSAITEIAIAVYNGTEVVERWETLVNPQKEIPFSITALTGISNAMVAKAPLFEEVAETVFTMLSNRIFVAHNVNFDYSFVHHKLQVAGYKWSAQKLCTVRASRKIIPGFASYSLGNLCKSLNIPIENHHRAGADVAATVVLLAHLLQHDKDGVINKMITNKSADQRLPANVAREDFDKLPEKPGVYYFYNKDNKVIYVGKAVNLKKRVASHFTGNKTTAQRQQFLKDIHQITFEVCGNELMALLLECTEIQKLWPMYNKALKRYEPKYGLYSYEARNGYQYLAVTKLQKHQQSVRMFHTVQEGNAFLRQLATECTIDYRFCKYSSSQENEVLSTIHTINLPTVEKHNKSIALALTVASENTKSFYIIDKGRSVEEQSCILIENGRFYGMGYLLNDIVITHNSEIKDYLQQYPSTHYIMQLIESYVGKYPLKVTYIE